MNCIIDNSGSSNAGDSNSSKNNYALPAKFSDYSQRLLFELICIHLFVITIYLFNVIPPGQKLE